MTTNAFRQDASAKLLDVQDIAERLKCSKRTVYRLIDSGKTPPPIRLGTLLRFSEREINAWIGEGCPAVKRRAGR